MEKMNRVLLSIGGNEGDREANLEEARMFISFNMGDVLKVSDGLTKRRTIEAMVFNGEILCNEQVIKQMYAKR